VPAWPASGVAFATATEWVSRLGDAQRQGRLDEELRRLLWTPLLIVDEVGYIPFDAQAANLMFSLVSSRYERASLIVTSNKPFSAWGEIFGDEVVAAAMIDRLVHHAEILSLKGDSYRLRDRDLGGRHPPASPKTDRQPVAAPARRPAERLSARRSPAATGPNRSGGRNHASAASPSATRKPPETPPRPRRPPASGRWPLNRGPFSTGASNQTGVRFQPAPEGEISTGLDILRPRRRFLRCRSGGATSSAVCSTNEAAA